MNSACRDACDFSNWPVKDRVRAIQRILPRRKLTALLRDEYHCSRLPAWFVVWFVVGIGLFCRDSYRQVFRWLQPSRGAKTPPRSTLCEARKRLGVARLRRVMDKVIELLGTATTPGAFYRNWRLMAVDGFVLDVADTKVNERAFGRPRSGRAAGAFPQVRCVSLCEAGSHVLYRTVLKPIVRSEIRMAEALMRYLTSDMLLLWDRNFLSFKMLSMVLQRRTQLLARIKKNLVFEPLEVLNDGSYLAKFYRSAKHRRHDRDGIVVRVIDYTINDPNRPGHETKHRLLTTLFDADDNPAEDLIVLYHERWEQEIAIDELKTHQRERPVLRSHTPAGVIQEVYGLLLGHYVVRRVMHDAATQAGVDPDRISFTNTLKIIRCRLAECGSGTKAHQRWYEAILAEASEELVEPRRNRINPRVIKQKMSNWEKKKPKHCDYPQPNKPFRESIKMLC